MDFNNFDFSNSSIIKPPTKEERNEHNIDNLIEQKLTWAKLSLMKTHLTKEQKQFLEGSENGDMMTL